MSMVVRGNYTELNEDDALYPCTNVEILLHCDTLSDLRKDT